MSDKLNFMVKRISSTAGFIKTMQIAIFALGIFSLSTIFSMVSEVNAAVRCETQYGGGETCVRTGDLQLNKKVWDPDKKDTDDRFVDNLGITAHRFVPGETITFKLFIKNVGDERFDKVYVTDTLPPFLELASDSPNKLTFEISDLTPGEEESREIKARVVTDNRVLDSTACDVNTAEAKSGDEHDKDTAQVCVSKKVLGASTIPVTGADLYTQALGLLALGLVGANGLLFFSAKKAGNLKK